MMYYPILDSADGRMVVHREDEETHLNAEEATGGSQENVVRWILGVSLVLIVVAMSLIWIIPSLDWAIRP